MKLRTTYQLVLLLAIFTMLETEARLETPTVSSMENPETTTQSKAESLACEKVAVDNDSLVRAFNLHLEVQALKAIAIDTLLKKPEVSPEVVIKAVRIAYLKVNDLATNSNPDPNFDTTCVEKTSNPDPPPLPKTKEAAFMEIERAVGLLEILTAKVASRSEHILLVEKATSVIYNCSQEAASVVHSPECCPGRCGAPCINCVCVDP